MKTTSITKNSKIATISTQTSYLQPVNDQPQKVDQLTINDIISDIQSLDKEAHEQIYLLIRGFKPAGFFTTDRSGGGTHFDLSELTDRQLLEMQRTIQLCKENQARQDVLQRAQLEHHHNMTKTI